MNYFKTITVLISFFLLSIPFLNASSVTPKIICNNPFSSQTVRAIGDWQIDGGGSSNFNPTDPNGLMEYDPFNCFYLVILRKLKNNYVYKWRISIDNSTSNNYGCVVNTINGANNAPDCKATTLPNGEIRLFMRINSNPYKLESDFYINECAYGPCDGICPVSPFASKIVRVSGNWANDTGGIDWMPDQPLGLMTYDTKRCIYINVVKGLKPKFQYSWKVSINNEWKESYGCKPYAPSDNDENCFATTDSDGAVRFLIHPFFKPPRLDSDLDVNNCANGPCNSVTTHAPVTTLYPFYEMELPGCSIFNDEICDNIVNQTSANSNVANRRWQTPSKPDQDNYFESFQDYNSLVGYADIRYTTKSRSEAEVCIIAKHKNEAVTLVYSFDDIIEPGNCKKYKNTYKNQVTLKVSGSDGTQLELPSITLAWNITLLKVRTGGEIIYRNGQKGAIVEMFGWSHDDVLKECQLLGKAGYLGAKLSAVHEQLLSFEPVDGTLNPWHFMYQPVSYKLDGRGGTRQELEKLIKVCRAEGIRIYVDIVLNHFTAGGNDMYNHRDSDGLYGCTYWQSKTSSAPSARKSSFYTHVYTYTYNKNTRDHPSNEFPGAAIGPEDFHCDRKLNSWSSLFELNNAWVNGYTDLDTSRENVRERQAAYLVEMLSTGITGFRLNFAKHMSPDDLAEIFKKVQVKMGGTLPDDFLVWLEVPTSNSVEANLLWSDKEGAYGKYFEDLLKSKLGSDLEVQKIKIFDGLYPKEPKLNSFTSRKRVVIQNDDYNQQFPGYSNRNMGQNGCVLASKENPCDISDHRSYQIRLFDNPFDVLNNAEEWPIRIILSSYYLKNNSTGIPDGLSDCNLCKSNNCSNECTDSVSQIDASNLNECAYEGDGFTKTHRDIKIINSMRRWMGLSQITNVTTLGLLERCN
jgi:alpha-amylase